ncbi:MAG: hypothetical protein KKB23_04405 [Proteobacteria bacterium]|nr:hypothetical protein [Pseudomonadota bacterium]MBU4388763.1 hypothetical protein [Pseudomonadota bacterium]
MTNLATFILGLYLGLSPVYWWPGVSPRTFAAFKFLLVFTGVLVVWVKVLINGQLALPRGLLGPFGFILLLVASIGGIAQCDISVSFIRIKDYLLSFVMLWTFFVYQRNGNDASRVFLIAGFILAAHCFLVVVSKVAGVPRWSGPREFVAPELWVSGFGSLRTGWSNASALFVPVLAAYFLDVYKRSAAVRIGALLALVSIVGSQLVVAGKAGILASLISIPMMLMMIPERRKLLVVYLVIVVLASVGLAGYMYKSMSLEQVQQQKQAMNKLDKFSAGRVSSDLKALELAADRPFQGYGFGNFTFKGTAIHNLWIRLLVDSGLFLPLILCLIVFVIFRILWRNRLEYCSSLTFRTSDEERRPTLIYYYGSNVIMLGILISMLEPSFILGAFQPSAVWWAVAGAGVALGTRYKAEG